MILVLILGGKKSNFLIIACSLNVAQQQDFSFGENKIYMLFGYLLNFIKLNYLITNCKVEHILLKT